MANPYATTHAMRELCTARFCMLASGSRGNCAVLDTPQGAVLLDFGIGPRVLDWRLDAIGITWDTVKAVLLTHTHTDHWKADTLNKLCKKGVKLYGHAKHFVDMPRGEVTLEAMSNAGLLQDYHFGYAFEIVPGLVVKPLEISHDSDPTAAFRFQGAGWQLGYAADLGVVPKGFQAEFAQADLLALEFNHNVEMLQNSGRSQRLIDRIKQDRGHLSNEQATAFLGELSAQNERLGHVVQLHLSQECNLPKLAREAVFQNFGNRFALTTAGQDSPTPWIPLKPWGTG